MGVVNSKPDSSDFQLGKMEASFSAQAIWNQRIEDDVGGLTKRVSSLEKGQAAFKGWLTGLAGVAALVGSILGGLIGK